MAVYELVSATSSISKMACALLSAKPAQGLFNLTLDVDTLLFNISTVESFRSFRPSSLGSLCLGPRDIHDSDFLGGWWWQASESKMLKSGHLVVLPCTSSVFPVRRLSCAFSSTREIFASLADCQCFLQLGFDFDCR